MNSDNTPSKNCADMPAFTYQAKLSKRDVPAQLSLNYYGIKSNNCELVCDVGNYSMPREIIINIMGNFPLQYIVQILRKVCRYWYYAGNYFIAKLADYLYSENVIITRYLYSSLDNIDKFDMNKLAKNVSFNGKHFLLSSELDKLGGASQNSTAQNSTAQNSTAQSNPNYAMQSIYGVQSIHEVQSIQNNTAQTTEFFVGSSKKCKLSRSSDSVAEGHGSFATNHLSKSQNLINDSEGNDPEILNHGSAYRLPSGSFKPRHGKKQYPVGKDSSGIEKSATAAESITVNKFIAECGGLLYVSKESKNLKTVRCEKFENFAECDLCSLCGLCPICDVCAECDLCSDCPYCGSQEYWWECRRRARHNIYEFEENSCPVCRLYLKCTHKFLRKGKDGRNFGNKKEIILPAFNDLKILIGQQDVNLVVKLVTYFNNEIFTDITQLSIIQNFEEFTEKSQSSNSESAASIHMIQKELHPIDCEHCIRQQNLRKIYVEKADMNKDLFDRLIDIEDPFDESCDFQHGENCGEHNDEHHSDEHCGEHYSEHHNDDHSEDKMFYDSD